MKRVSFATHPEKFIERVIRRYARKSPLNTRKSDGGRYWNQPLVGFASGVDPLFKQYKKVIGSFHLTPKEIMQKAFRKALDPEKISVISWVLPAAQDVRKSNRKETKYPSFLWSHTREYGEKFNVALRDHIVSLLKKKGHRAVAPLNSPHFRRVKSPKVGLASNWSERHIAFVCGLGTFGLSDGFITRKGKAIRVGSVVTDLPLKPSPRHYQHPYGHCLFYFDQSCKDCASRCPAGAITAKGHDKDKCRQYTHGVIKEAKQPEYGVVNIGCGLCQTKVRCEFEIPKKIQKYYRRKMERSPLAA